MANRYSESLIEEVIQRNDIVSVISEYVHLKKTGKNFKGLCPFHNEKTPSFFVSDDKQVYHCFGCGESGNVIQFIMNIESLDFIDAIEFLADKSGLNINTYRETNFKTDTYDKKKKLLEINREAAIYYYKNLVKTQNPGMKYFKKRGFDNNIIKRFGLGYALDSWDGLKNYLLNKGFSIDLIYESGLIIRRKENKGYYDRFRNRVIFPIIMPPKKIVGFGGRVLDNSLPKYLNSPESIVFDKSNILYGLNLAKNELGKEKKLILVEGYTDVISLYKQGIKNVVATLGTSLTKQHGELLKRYCDEVIIAYDSDTAGEAATIRGLEILSEVGCKVKVVRFNENMDPDEYVNKYGQEGFMDRIQNALPLIDYKLELIKKNVDFNTNEGKISYIKESIKILRQLMKSPVELDIYVRKLSKETDVPTKVIKSEIYGNNRDGKTYSRYRSYNNGQKYDNMVAITKTEKNGTYEVEKNIISLSLSSKTNYRKIINQINKDYFINDKLRNIFMLVKNIYKEDDEIKIEKLIENIDLQDGKLINEIIHTSVPSDDIDATISDLTNSLKRFKIEDEIKKVKEEIRALKEKENKQEGDVMRERVLCMRLTELLKELRDAKIN